jgi:hypothetical protein
VTPGGFTYEIYVPKADLTLIEVGPPAKYELDVDAFRLELRDLEDDPDGRPWPKTHIHDTETTLGGVTYARKVQVLAPYSVTFEDGQYRVTLVGANNNILDVSNVNQVSIAPTNSAGLISAAGIAAMVPDVTLIRQILANDMNMSDGDTANLEVLDDQGADPVIEWDATDKNDGPILIPVGYPAKRRRRS